MRVIVHLIGILPNRVCRFTISVRLANMPPALRSGIWLYIRCDSHISLLKPLEALRRTFTRLSIKKAPQAHIRAYSAMRDYQSVTNSACYWTGRVCGWALASLERHTTHISFTKRRLSVSVYAPTLFAVFLRQLCRLLIKLVEALPKLR